MSFATPVFLLLFLPVTVLAYHLFRSQRHPSRGMLVLCLASLVFYASWDVRYLPLLIGSAAANFAIGERIGRASAGCRLWLAAGLILDLGLLAYFKYADFFLASAAAAFGGSVPLLKLVLPLGISFFTFTQIAYLVDIHGGHRHDRDFVGYLLFVTYFPHLIAGPIIHHGDVMPQFRARLGERLRADRLAVGLTFLALGLFKKVVVADGVGIYAQDVFEHAATGHLPTLIPTWVSALAYSLQLYFDFSGYCDMAIGLSWMFGIRMPVNFDSPYKATSIIDFWRRWHMTLSRFLRDYLYLPLGGNRQGALRHGSNIMVVMLLGGLWHGAGWTFVAWGGLHGVFLVVNHLFRRLAGGLPDTPAGAWCGRLLTFVCVVFAWVFFRAADLPTAGRIAAGLLGLNGVMLPDTWQRFGGLANAAASIGLGFGPVPHFHGVAALAAIAALIAAVWVSPNSQQIMARTGSYLGGGASAGGPRWWHWQGRPAEAAAWSGILLAALYQVLFSEHVQFLYFQF